MWCPSCSADVAAELSVDDRRFLCTRCQTELGLTAATMRPAVSEPIAAERDARELLAKWSTHSVLDQPLRTVYPRESALNPVPLDASQGEPEAKPEPTVRIRRHKLVRRAPAIRVEDQSDRRDPGVNGPLPTRTGLWLSTVGQLAAYAGIGLITCGTALVIWSHYGGPVSYAPTGWLISALGQMLFFLGLVNLVSGSLDHTSAEVRQQIEQLRSERHRVDPAHEHGAVHRPHSRRKLRREAA